MVSAHTSNQTNTTAIKGGILTIKKEFLMKKHIPSNLETLTQTANRILLLQGPIGYFFRDFSNWLSQTHRKRVFKINFNCGDECYYPNNLPNTFAYRDPLEQFAEYLTIFIKKHRIHAIVCFGDTRPYHQIAKRIAEQHQLKFWVFEEGYFRPFLVTLEQHGVNALSHLPQQATFFLNSLPKLAQQHYQAPPEVPAGFWVNACPAMRYYYQARRGQQHYPHYIHHRAYSVRFYCKNWLYSVAKRACHWSYEWIFNHKVKQGKLGRFYIVPLQVSTDSQIRFHSDFSSVQSFLMQTMASFALYAPKDSKLIIKHHPMDRGFTNYRKYIRAFIKKHPDCKHRIFYVHDVSLPELLRKGAGMVVVNSTSGLSALLHNMPVIALGRANYDFESLTFQGNLRDFWTKATPPDPKVFHAFRQYHMNVTQINGHFYSKVNLPH